MTLATRLSLFFLASLATVLGGFSIALYLAAAVYFDRQATERLEAALRSLTAAAEIENGRLEWEPHNRSIQVERRNDAARLLWRVTDDLGRAIDSSSDSSDAAQAWGGLAATPATGAAPVVADSADNAWRVARVIIAASRSKAMPESRAFNDGVPAALIIEAAVPLGPMHAVLQRLGWVVTVLSCSLWLLSAAVGRAICRRALEPLTAMAAAARAMPADALSTRLPEPNTHDECHDLARAFNDLLSRVEEAFERQRQFTGNASHQLRTPLAGILGQIEVALRRERTPIEYQRVLEVLQQRADELQELVEALLFLARTDCEAVHLRSEPVDLGHWLGECLECWPDHPRADDLRVALNGHSCRARIHRPLAAQLLGNLIDNACKHSSPGTPILVRLTETQDKARLEIADQGVGIAASELPHIFEPFYRSPDARNRGLPGAGLGLAVARRIATALGGQLLVESQVGAGSRFELLLPLDNASSGDEATT